MSDGKRILILHADLNAILPFAWYYKRLGYKTIGAYSGFYSGIFSKSIDYRIHLPLPGIYTNEKEKINFIKKIVSVCRRYRVSLILSFGEDSTEPLVKYKHKIKIMDIFPSYTSYRILLDKSLLKQYIEKENPRSFYIPRSFTASPKFPCIVKPNIGYGGMYTVICNNYAELNVFSTIIKQKNAKPVIEEYIPAEDIVGMNLLIDRKFRIKRVVMRKVVSENKIMEIIDELEKFFKKIRYFGFASPQFIIANQKLYLSEINPRLINIPFGVYGLSCEIDFPDAFHTAIIRNRRIDERFFFIDRRFKFKILRAFRMYRKNYNDNLMSFIALIEYLHFVSTIQFRRVIFTKYRKWFRFSYV